MKEFQDFTFLYLKNNTPCNLEKRQFHLACFHQIKFSKSKNLYALNLARGYVQRTNVKDKRLVIVEGYTDVVAAWQAGLTNVVAALGVALNEQHIRLIKRFADGINLRDAAITIPNVANTIFKSVFIIIK